MLYNLQDELSRKQFAARVRHLWNKGSVVELTDKSKRTGKQNNYLHSILSILCIETGYALEDVKREIFKKRINPDIFIRYKEDPVLGRVEVVRSSRDLTIEEMSIAIDRYKKFCAEQGFYIPEPGEEEMLRQIEWEMAKIERYL